MLWNTITLIIRSKRYESCYQKTWIRCIIEVICQVCFLALIEHAVLISKLCQAISMVHKHQLSCALKNLSSELWTSSMTWILTQLICSQGIVGVREDQKLHLPKLNQWSLVKWRSRKAKWTFLGKMTTFTAGNVSRSSDIIRPL